MQQVQSDVTSFAIKVSVHTLSGETLTLDAKLYVDLDDLKEQIKTQWHIPTPCQKLTANPEMASSIRKACLKFVPLPFTMVVSAHTLYQDLRSESAGMKRKALSHLANLPKKFKIDKDPLEACMRHNNCRSVAADILQEREGNDAVVDSLLRQVGDASVDPLQQAWALGRLFMYADYGSERVLTAICPALDSPFKDVRKAAAGALQALGTDTEMVIEPLRECLNDGRQCVERAAAKALMSLGSGGRDALCRHVEQTRPLQDSEWLVRTLVKALPDDRILQSIFVCAHDNENPLASGAARKYAQQAHSKWSV